MITEDYVSFETAKLLKEKEFDGDTNCYYIEGNVDKNLCYSPIRQNHNKRITNNEFDIDINISSEKISAPTLQMAMKWLREVHNLFISISTWLRHKDGTVQYCYEIRNLNDKDFKTAAGCTITEFDSYEKTGEAAIRCCLENLI